MPIDPFAVARQLDERDARIAELEAENAKLRRIAEIAKEIGKYSKALHEALDKGDER